MKKYTILTLLVIMSAFSALADGDTNKVATVQTNAAPAAQVVAPAPAPAPIAVNTATNPVITYGQIKQLVTLGTLLVEGNIDQHNDYDASKVRDKLEVLQDAIQFERNARKNMAQLRELLRLLDQASSASREPVR